MSPPIPHDSTNCPDIGHIKDKIDSMAEQIERLTSLMERQIWLEEQAANHAAAVFFLEPA